MKILIEIVLILLFCFSCSSTKPEPEISDISETTEDINEPKNLFIEDAEPFYPIKETVEDIQTQVNELRSRMIDYEERIASSNLNNSISKLVLYHPVALVNASRHALPVPSVC